MSANLLAYTNYFRSLAVSHVDLQHDPVSETGKAGSHKKAFIVFGNEEIINGIRTELKPNVLGVELYETQLRGEAVYDIKQKPSGALMVISHANDVTNFIDVINAYAKAEEILYQLLQKIWHDHYGPSNDRCLTPLCQFYFNTSEILPTGLVFDSYYGWHIQFTFEFQKNNLITKSPAEGVFV